MQLEHIREEGILESFRMSWIGSENLIAVFPHRTEVAVCLADAYIARYLGIQQQVGNSVFGFNSKSGKYAEMGRQIFYFML